MTLIESIFKVIGVVIGIITLFMLIIFITTVIVKYAWLWSVVTIFEFAPLSWTQAFWLSVLSSTLFKNTQLSWSKK